MWNDRFSFRRLFDDDDFDKEFAKAEEMLNKMLRTVKDENIQSLKKVFHMK
jgi:thiaminase